MPYTMVKNKTITAILSTAVLLAAAALVVGIFQQQTVTYVRIADVGLSGGNTNSPGADIRGVSMRREGGDKTWYADAVISGNINNGAEGNNNEYKDPEVLLGDPNEKESPEHLSLGGGDIVVRLPIMPKQGSEIQVYEVGSKTGSLVDTYEVSWSKNANGPWHVLGQSDGLATFTIGE